MQLKQPFTFCCTSSSSSSSSSRVSMGEGKASIPTYSWVESYNVNTWCLYLQSKYKTSWSAQNISNIFLKLFMNVAVITSLGKLFHMKTTLTLPYFTLPLGWLQPYWLQSAWKPYWSFGYPDHKGLMKTTLLQNDTYLNNKFLTMPSCSCINM